MSMPFFVYYQEYTGWVVFDAKAGSFFGKVIGIDDVITFQGKTEEEVDQAFHDSVDEYLAFCKDLGEAPERAPRFSTWTNYGIRYTITITVNGLQYYGQVQPRMLLVDYLREVLDLTGTHIGCDTSQCGACTVLLNGDAVKSCTVLAVQADGCEVTTIEGFALEDRLHPIQEAFWERHGVQCGFCTPGMIIAAYELLKNNPDPTEEEIRRALAGNICRCTGYQNIVRAVQMAAEQMRMMGLSIPTAAKKGNNPWNH